jgi:glycine cleavage system H protein
MTESTEVPAGLYYTKDHEWVSIQSGVAVVGITDYAQKALGDITYVDLPPLGKEVKQFQELAAVESAKAAVDVFAPVSGTVADINPLLDGAPETVNSAPYGAGWLCKLKGVRAGEVEGLLTAQQYSDFLRQKKQ